MNTFNANEVKEMANRVGKPLSEDGLILARANLGEFEAEYEATAKLAEMLNFCAEVLDRIENAKLTEADFMNSKFADVKGYTIGEVSKRSIELLNYLTKAED